MLKLKKLALVLALGLLAVLGGLVASADNLPAPSLPNPLDIHWGRPEPLKTQTLKRVDDIDAQIQDGGR